MIFTDFLDLSYGLSYMMAVLREYSFRSLDTSYRRTALGREAVSTFLVILNFLPVTVTTWVITRRKNIIPVLLCYAPFFGCSVALNYMFPDQKWCVLAFACIIVLVIFQNTRKVDRRSAEKRLLFMLIPALVLTVCIGIIYPQDSYDKNKMAEQRLASIKKTLQIRTIPNNEVTQAVSSVAQKVEHTYMGSIIVENLANSSVIASLEREDLNLVGNFNPPVFRIMTVRRTVNPDYHGTHYNGNYLYLKTTSYDWYEDRAWVDSHECPDFSHTYLGDVEPQEAQFAIQMTPKQTTRINFIPYYTDFYKSTTNTYINDPFEMSVGLNTEMKGEEISTSSYAYLMNTIPVNNFGNWTQDYLDYVYSTCLQVPQETVDALLTSNKLPDWYLDVYYGETTMSDYDKVLAVTDYVRSLHPYDASTDFAPKDKDFVVWFIEDAKTGFCVHYACTAVVLLRMIDVPARYVTGYMVSDVTNSKTADVYSSDAHAWFEFFSEEYGWVMEDPTPGNQTAASGFNISAILSALNPDATPIPSLTASPTNGSTDNTPTPTKEPFYTATPEPTRKMNNDEESPKTHLLASWKARVAVFFIALAVILVLLRLSYVLYWKRSFKKGTINERARAYYRYTNFIMTLLSARATKKISTIAQKAAFSEEGITQQEFDTLLAMCRRSIDSVVSKHSRIEQILLSISAKVKI